MQRVINAGIECHQHYLDTHANEENGLLSYSQFARYLSAHRKRRAPEYRHHYLPGDILEMDFAGDRPTYHHAQAGQVKCKILLTVLPFSQLYTAKVIQSEKRRDVVHGLIQIFSQLEGLPQRLVFDNFKAAVDRPRTKKQRAKINPEFLAMLDYYGIAAAPARAGEPRDKGSVEAGVRLLQRYVRRKLRHFIPRTSAG